MKKGFTDTDQIEALDYGERLLCFQRGRRRAYCALFHCCEGEKMIQWLEIREEGGRFMTRISRPQSLAPGGIGQRELLTVMMMPSADLGLDFPEVQATGTNELVKVSSILGEGATSMVYATLFRGQNGVLKLLKEGFHHLADREVKILHHLHRHGVSGIPPSCEKSLIACLEETHSSGVVHRDVRPSNIMQDVAGSVRLIDWGLAHHQSLGPEAFAGTFRFASSEVLESAVKSEPRLPLPKDDLHSLVRVILAQNSSIAEDLENIADGDLQTARGYWLEKRKKNQQYECMFVLAEKLAYSDLKEAMFS